MPIGPSALSAECTQVRKICCALSAECTPELRVMSAVQSAVVHCVWCWLADVLLVVRRLAIGVASRSGSLVILPLC